VSARNGSIRSEAFLRATVTRSWERIIAIQRELRELRQRLERAELLVQALATSSPRLPGRCRYCGEPTTGRACRSHADLMEVEQ
jgi:hypothetical protein